MRILMLHNPNAGRGDVPAEALVEWFEACGHDVTYRSTKSDGFDASEARAADATVICGGDGTLGAAVRALDGALCPIAIVPLGTSNNVAKALGLMAEPEAVARGLETASERRVDVGVAEGPWGRRLFLEAVGLGLVAELISEGSERKLEGEDRERFLQEAPHRILEAAEPRSWDVTVDGTRLEGEFLFLEVLNIPVAGPGLRLCWPEKSDDGAFEVGYLRPDRRTEMLAWFGTDRREVPGALEVAPGRDVSFTWAGGTLRIDDFLPDPPASPAAVSLHLEDTPLRVLVPPETAEGA
jgi:diacylglycerol kinase (ATP)